MRVDLKVACSTIEESLALLPVFAGILIRGADVVYLALADSGTCLQLAFQCADLVEKTLALVGQTGVGGIDHVTQVQLCQGLDGVVLFLGYIDSVILVVVT